MISKKIALFASGRGSNALNIIDYFAENSVVKVQFLLCNKKEAPVVKSAQNKGIEVVVCSNEDIESPNFLVKICEEKQIDYIILAGFLRKIPHNLVAHFENKIINIHPSLLPKYGGEGMYGKFVHEAVLAKKEKETGITIHFVNAEYDKGEIIAQFSCKLDENDTLESVQEKIHRLEMEHFPEVIEDALRVKN